MHYRWFDEDEDEDERRRMGRFSREKPEDDAPTPSDVKKRLSGRMEVFGSIMAAGVFLYGFAVRDIPILYLSAAFLLYVASPYVRRLGEPTGPFLSNLLRGFSIVLFFGALLMTFF